MSQGATIKDVAQKAKVSEATVSLVLNNKANIRAETRQRVLKAVQQLNYHPRHAARGLASRKSGNIGFILTDDHFSLAEPFYTKIFLGTEFESRKFKYYILLTTVPRSFRVETDLPRFLRERNVDGVLLAGHVPNALSEHILKLKLPHVFVDFSPRHKQGNVVMMDNLLGAKLAVRHLLDLGHRRIAFIGGDITHPSIATRLEGYKQALLEAQLAAADDLIETVESNTATDDGTRAAEKLLARGAQFTALFAANDAMAIGAMQCLKQHGQRIPVDVSIVGFDDVEVGTHTQPPLTTIRVDKEELGAVALRRLMEMIETKKELPGKVFTPVELVVRQSTAPPASVANGKLGSDNS
ncbi:LacI family DNA-binding transcriptional regulator [candidate division KSB1 bacterium]|nr:LacI family DNA-binding transcriptional regulator [candidate division KSB1 bacterium]